MIPILYDTNETAFANNGIARLRDVISAVVTEERNGIYELDFEYPITGANYDLIQLGRIVAVTHDDTGDVQPFDIVSYTKPIDGVITFHCTHISYRLTYNVVSPAAGSINSLNGAFTAFSSAVPSMPFSFATKSGDKSGFLAAADGLPHSVRQMLGGMEGSILDTFGGEYEFDKWNVNWYSARGQIRDFSIRYGVNMLEFEDETDTEGAFSSCVPYWANGEEIVIGNRTTSNGSTVTGRGECVPLDMTDKFETKPTKTQLQNAAKSYMNANNTFLAGQTITVSFVRLQDMGEFADYQNLMTCGLCDTINVIFPDYKTQGQFKIVKTVWNVLLKRYDEMELGTLSTSLAEALGITTSADRTSSTFNNLSVLNDLSVGGSEYLTSNNTGLYGTKSDDVTRRLLIGFSATNNVVVGYDNYSNSDGDTNIYGDDVHIYSNNTITADKTVTIAGNPMGLIAQEVTLNDNVSISGNTYGNNSHSVAKSGYVPIAIAGMHLTNASSSGVNNTQCAVHSFYLSGNTAYWIVRNTSSAAAKIKVTATILYVKS